MRSFVAADHGGQDRATLPYALPRHVVIQVRAAARVDAVSDLLMAVPLGPAVAHCQFHGNPVIETRRHFGSLPLAKLYAIDVPEGSQPQDLRRRIASLNRALKTGVSCFHHSFRYRNI
jgi:hypothetical protein